MTTKPPSGLNMENYEEAVQRDHVPEGFSFRKALKDYVEARPDKVYDHVSPSSLGHCVRKHVYQIRKIKATTPPDEAALINFLLGDVWEKVILEALEHNGIKYQFQVPCLNEELNLGGTLDFIIPTPEGEIVADSKTMRSEWFWFLANTNQSFVEKNPEYRLQLGSYMLLRKLAGKDPLYGQFPFISKNDGMIWREIRVKWDAQLEDDVRQRVAYVQSFLDSGDLPPCECEGWKIGYCDYGDPNTREKNKKGKLLNTTCCAPELFDGADKHTS